MLTQAQVGRFEIRDFLGRGAIGDVYLAWDPRLGSEIALKLVRTRKTDQDMVAAERNGTALQTALARVAPQVAAVYEQGDHDGLYWVAMEYVAGDDLAAVIERESPLPEERAVRIALQLCEMLEMFHEFSMEGRRGIVHGDLKPENIRLQDGDHVRVLDFGIAKHLSQTRKFTVNLFGSLPYVPPERLSSGRVDAGSDLWALGVILYLMVAGYPPWSGQDAEELESRIRRGDPPAPLPESCSPELKKILYRTLASDPERRYPSAAELRADLEAWREGRSASPPGPLSHRPPAGRERGETGEQPLYGEGGGAPLPEEGSAVGEGTGVRAPGGETLPDLGATRRTMRSLDATHRTYEPIPPPAVEVPASRLRRRRALALVIALVTLIGISQVWVQSKARELQHDLVTDTDPDLGAILERYRKLSWIGLFNPTLGEVRDELREALVTQADRILEGYRDEYPRVRERGWQQAYDFLQGAMELNYLDRKVRAKMLYAKGHLDRIASQTLRQRGESSQAEEKIDAAVSEFRDAARRDRNWPDPYLGLARVYAYERPDLEQLQKALVELERRGYHPGRRERAMEADGYRRQAEALWLRAQRARGTDGEVDLLEKTRDNLLQAINFYEDAAGYADVRTNQIKAASRLEQVQRRMRELEAPGLAPDLLHTMEDVFGIKVPGEDDGG